MDGKSLQARLLIQFPQSNPELQEFPSGSFMIDIALLGDIYVIEYVSGQGYGFSNQKGASFGWEGVDQSFENVEQLESYIRNLVASLS